jgi:hypothetical protein
LERFVPFLVVESDWKSTNTPSKPTSPPNTSNQNFEIAIFFSVVDFQIEIIFLRRTLSSSPQGKGCKLFSGDI